jgi:hypothetical protein
MKNGSIKKHVERAACRKAPATYRSSFIVHRLSGRGSDKRYTIHDIHYHIVSLLSGLFLLVSLFAHAQDSPSVKASIDRTHILIGEQIRLGMDISIPAGTAVQLPQPDTIPHFVILGSRKLDSVSSASGTAYHLEWKLTSFDSGLCKIPAFPVVIGNHRYYSDSLLVEVSYGNLDSAADYHDIRGILDIENPAVKYILWVLLGLTVLAVFLFIRFAFRPGPPAPAGEAAPKATALSPFDEAMASLDALKKTSRADAASVKKYYSAMNDVLRVFLSRSLGLRTMERTNEELILQLGSLDMRKEDFSRLAAALRMSDFVKFAKYVPDIYDNEQNLETIRSSIVLIHEMRK